MQTLIRLHDAAFGYGGRPVVSGVDLELGPESFLGILGPNGAGKTTLVRGMLGLLRPLSGSVERLGARLGYVPQRDAIDPIFPFTTGELVATGAWGRLSRWSGLGPDAVGEVRAALERVGLAQRASEPFRELSGGQRQRALVARALLSRPNVLVLDEPTGGVDRAAAEQILALLLELHGSERIGIALVSHQLGFLRRAVRQALWVDAGSVRPLSEADLARPEALAELFDAAEGAPLR